MWSSVLDKGTTGSPVAGEAQLLVCMQLLPISCFLPLPHQTLNSFLLRSSLRPWPCPVFVPLTEFYICLCRPPCLALARALYTFMYVSVRVCEVSLQEVSMQMCVLVEARRQTLILGSPRLVF